MIDPASLVAFLDARSTYHTSGYPVRRRKRINGQPVDDVDARMIRRWRKGDIKRVQEASVRALLRRFEIDPGEFTN